MSAIRALTFTAVLSLFAGSVAVAQPKPVAEPAVQPPPGALAVVDGVAITEAEVEQTSAGPLLAVRTQAYEIRRQAIEEMIAGKLLAKEAVARGVTVAELVQQEIASKTAPVSEEEVASLYESVKARFAGTSEADLKSQLRASRQQQSVQARRSEFVGSLRGQAKVRIFIEPYRVSLPDSGWSKGAADAPITLVEFSDFECPYCSRVVDTLKKLEARYGRSLRIVFRDYPLPIHARAGKAAEAAACAGDQGRFWEMHDRLFANQNALAVPDLKKQAGEIGLDAVLFATCLDSGRRQADWQRSAEEARRIGIQVTPSFFVNGRLLSGARPYEDFVRAIDEELERTGLPIPPPPAALKPAN